MGREYIKLVAINVGDFESQISFERNYPDTEEGQKTCQQDKKCARKRVLSAILSVCTVRLLPDNL